MPKRLDPFYPSPKKQAKKNDHGGLAAVRKTDDADTRELHCYVHSVSAVLKLVSERKFLQTRDLGRLWLLTSKEMTIAAYGRAPSTTDDLLWKILLASQLGDPATNLILKEGEATGITLKDRFLKIMPHPTPKTLFVVPKLNFKPSDYVFFINVWDNKKDREFARRVVSGRDMSQFFVDGVGKLKLDETVEIRSNPKKKLHIAFDWTWRVNLLRLPDNKFIRDICGIYEVTETFWLHFDEGDGLVFVDDDPRITHVAADSTPPEKFMTSKLLDQYRVRRDDSQKILFAPDFLYESKEIFNRSNDSFFGTLSITFLFEAEIFDEDYDDENIPVYETLESKRPSLSFAHFLESLPVWNHS